MGGIGIVSNPGAAASRRDPGAAARLARLLGDDGLALEAGTPDALGRAVEALAAARVDTLAVDGGDGTAHLVLTALAAAWGPGPLPRFLPLRGGTMNVVAGCHGHTGPPAAILSAHLAARRAGHLPAVAERDLLRVELDGGAPLLGFLFATGVAVTFLERLYAGRAGPLRAWALLGRAAVSLAGRGRLARSLTHRQPLEVVADGEAWPEASWLTVLAGTVPSIGLGLKPLARCDEQPGFFHAVGVHGPLPWLVRSLPRLRRGGPWRRRAAVDAVARRLTIEGDGVRATVDGDLYPPARSVRITTGPPIEVFCAPGHRPAGPGHPAAARPPGVDRPRAGD